MVDGGGGASATAVEAMAARRVWLIDVCRTCNRLAQWPFCEHRPAHFAPDTPRWYETVRVRETGGGR